MAVAFKGLYRIGGREGNPLRPVPHANRPPTGDRLRALAVARPVVVPVVGRVAGGAGLARAPGLGARAAVAGGVVPGPVPVVVGVRVPFGGVVLAAEVAVVGVRAVPGPLLKRK
jgi:hypothetical protein